MTLRPSHLLTALLVLLTAAVLWPNATALSGKPTIRFVVWGMPFEDRLFHDIYAEQYQALHPALNIDYRRYGDDIMTKYLSWHAVGKGAEVTRIRITDYHGLVARGMLEPLSKYIHDPHTGLSAQDIADFPPDIWAKLQVSGDVFALPEDNAQYGLYYNKAIFDAYNAAHPDDFTPYPSADWNWQDLRTAARKLTTYDKDGRIQSAGIDFHIWAWPFMTFFVQAGGRQWSDDGLTCLIDSQAGFETLDFFRALQRDDRSFRASFGTETGTGPEALFATGRTALYFDGTWRGPYLDRNAPTLDYAVSPLPHGEQAAVITGSVLWGISSKAAHKDAGWEMIKWLTDPPQAIAYWDTLRVAPPARLSVLNSPAFRSTHGIPDGRGGWEVPPMPEMQFEAHARWILYALTPDPKTGRTPGFVPVSPYQTEMEDELQRVLETFLNPSSTESAQTVLDRAVRTTHAIIDRDRAAKGIPPVERSFTARP